MGIVQINSKDDAMRVLVMGASGMLGSGQCNILGNAHQISSGQRADIAQLAELREMVERVEPDIVINAAAHTDVDGCETDKKLT
jgi:dTDP-4-dehydrorhamnose reductase